MQKNTTIGQHGILLNATSTEYGRQESLEVFNYSCRNSLQGTSYYQFYELSPAFITYSKVIGGINCAMPIPAIVANLLYIITIAKFSQLQTTANMIFINMSCKNLIEAALSQPSYAVIIFSRIHRQPFCFNRLTCFLGCACLVETMCTQTMIAYEQYTSLFHPFSYERRMSLKVIIPTILLSWTLSIACAIGVCLFEELQSSAATVVSVIIITANASTIYAHVKIYKLIKAMRKTDEENRVGEESDATQIERNRREGRTAKIMFYVIFLPTILYLPTFIRNILITAIGYEIWSSYAVDTIMQLHSIISPILYAYHNPSISMQIKGILKCRCGTVHPN